MNFWSVDSETHLISPGCLAPRAVCYSTAERAASGEMATELVLRPQGLLILKQRLESDSIIIGANLPFDFGVACAEDPSLVPLVFDAYAAGRVSCVQTLQKLMDVALGMRKWRRVGNSVSRATYGLDDLVKLYFNEHLEKVDTWRLRYSELDGVPIEEWPADAKTYAIGDAVQALRVREAQEREIKELWGELPNQAEQQRAAWALHLMSMWGVRADARGVDKFEASCREHIAKMHSVLIDRCQHCSALPEDHDNARCREAEMISADDDGKRAKAVARDGEWENTGIFRREKRCKTKGCGLKREEHVGVDCTGKFVSRSIKEIQRRIIESCEKQQIQVPLTDPSTKFPHGQVQTDKDAILLTDDPMLIVLNEEMVFQKMYDQWGPVGRAAVERPVCPRYNVLVDTGRTSCSGDKEQKSSNFQNPNRKGDVRQMFVPRPGWVFLSTDADAVEGRGHAQDCLDMGIRSRMAEAFIEQAQSGGPDIHEILGASIIGIAPSVVQQGNRDGDKSCEEARQFAKVPQYGFIGGLGSDAFVAYAAGMLEYEEFVKWFGSEPGKQRRRGKEIREAWFAAWPENHDYFRLIGDMLRPFPKGEGVVRHFMSGRIRGGSRFTGTANGFMQGRVADAMKDVLWNLALECYTGRCTSLHQHGGSSTCTYAGLSIMEGSRPNFFLHDEPITEVREDGHESDRAMRQQQIMVENLQKWMPAIPCSSTPVLMRRWFKGSKPVKVKGKLVPSRAMKDDAGKTRWVHDVAA
jgi:hypothetical protein